MFWEGPEKYNDSLRTYDTALVAPASEAVPELAWSKENSTADTGHRSWRSAWNVAAVPVVCAFVVAAALGVVSWVWLQGAVTGHCHQQTCTLRSQRRRPGHRQPLRLQPNAMRTSFNDCRTTTSKLLSRWMRGGWQTVARPAFGLLTSRFR